MNQTSKSVASSAAINVHPLNERHAWARIFGVAPAELVSAIKAVGTDAEAVLLHLRSKGRKPMADWTALA